MEAPRPEVPATDPAHDVSTDDVVADSAARVRSSKALLDQINQRLARGKRLLDLPGADLSE